MNTVCGECAHWRGDVLGADKGDCTLSPEWRKVEENHYCGQFRAESGSSSYVSRLSYYRMRGEINSQRERAIKAEKTAKELRRLLREARKP